MAKNAKTDSPNDPAAEKPIVLGPDLAVSPDERAIGEHSSQPPSEDVPPLRPSEPVSGKEPETDLMPGAKDEPLPWGAEKSLFDTETLASEPTSSSQGGSPAPIPAPRRSAMPMLLAGVVTAGLGLGAGWALWAPNGPFAGTSAIDARFAALEAQLTEAKAAATSAAEAASAAQAGVAPLAERLGAAEKALPPLSEALTALRTEGGKSAEAVAALEAKLADLAQRPPASDPAAVAAYERELAALRETFAGQLAEIRSGSDRALAEIHATLGSELGRIEAQSKAAAEASEESAAVQAKAERVAALAALSTALDTGLPLAEPVARLSEQAPDLPLAALSPYSDGVPTLLALQESFPESARRALSAETFSGNGEGGISGALKGFLGMRSLAPQDGTSTDAVLSRAEAALTTGDLAKTLTELDALPAAPAAELAEWRGKADKRLAAMAAFTTISDAVEK